MQAKDDREGSQGPIPQIQEREGHGGEHDHVRKFVPG